MTVARLITHSVIAIAAPVTDVWPHILEPNGWKQGLKPMRVEGEPDTVGEIREASVEQAGTTLCLRCETAVLSAPTRKVVRLTTGSDLDPAWAAWHLTEVGGVTTVNYDVYGEVDIGASDPADYVRDNQQRFDSELLALRQLVEAGC